MKNSNENQIIRFDWAMKRLLITAAAISVQGTNVSVNKVIG